METDPRKPIELLCRELKMKGVCFGSKQLLSQLHESESDLPKLIEDYILNCIPSFDIVDEELIILGSDSFLEKNLNYSPAIFIKDIGFWTIATFYDGSAFVVDAETGEILLVDPGYFFFNEGTPVCLGDEGDEPVSRKFVLEKSESQADNLSAFFCRVIERQ